MRTSGSLVFSLPILILTCLSGPLSLAAGPQTAPGVLITPAVRRSMDEIRGERIRAHVRYLADDLLQGRDTGSPGSMLAARYLAAQFEQFGLKPVGDGGSYYQQVPFVNSAIDSQRSRLVLAAGGKESTLEFGKDFLLSAFGRPSAQLSAPMVFAGYGITAPEYQHDDYKDLDAKGKLVVVLVGEPVSRNPAVFDGDKDTKYSGSGSKISLARSRGAVGLILVLHGRRAQEYRWDENRAAQAKPTLQLPALRGSGFPTLVLGSAAAERLFAGAPTSWADVQKRAAEGVVEPFPLPHQAKLDLVETQTPQPCPNVVGLVEGSDPQLKKQVVVYTAHYDHVGTRTGEGDTIYNGAWDNASGTAEVLEVARAFASLQPAPRRSILFLLVTGEERGLLGSRYYVRHPIVPIQDTAANINLDMADIFGIPREFVPLGAERSTLQQSSEAVAREMGMKIGKDPVPELNVFFRSDQFSFVQAGVPSLFLQWASDYEDVDAATAKARAAEKLRTVYHNVRDNFDPTWSWEGMRRHAHVAFLLGLHVASQPEMPSWKAGDAYNMPRKPVGQSSN